MVGMNVDTSPQMVEAKRQRLKEAECEAKFQQFLKRKGQRPAGKRRVLTNADKWKPAPSSSEQDAGSQVLTPGRKARLEVREWVAMQHHTLSSSGHVETLLGSLVPLQHE